MLFMMFARQGQEQEDRQKGALAESEKRRLQKLAQLCQWLGLRSERDTEGTVIRVVEFMIIREDSNVSATELSRESGLNRITCLHHLKRLAAAGLVSRQHGTYKLSEDLDAYVEHRMAQMLEEFKDMRRLVREIEKELE